MNGTVLADSSSLYLCAGGISVAYPLDGVWQHDLGSGHW